MVSDVEAPVRAATTNGLAGQRLLMAAGLAVLLALPLFVPRYWVFFAGLLGINIIATHGLNIMMGYPYFRCREQVVRLMMKRYSKT